MKSHSNVVDIGMNPRVETDRQAEELSSKFLLSIINSSPDCIKMVELDGTVSFMNFNGQCAMEIDDFGKVSGKRWCKLWPDAAAILIDEAVDKARHGEASRFEALCPTAKGTKKWWDVSVTPVLDSNNRVERILSVSRDITLQIEREQRLREHDMQTQKFADNQVRLITEKEKLLEVQDTLMREMDHRVKNSLAMISSLLRMQAQSSSNEAAAQELDVAANRVLTVSRVHEKLHQGTDVNLVNLRDYLGPLCAELKDAVGDNEIALCLNVEETTVSADAAVSLGLITAELLANAFRHAFDKGAGTISVSCVAKPDGKHHLVVTDDGIGLPDGFDIKSSNSLGTKIIRLYSMQLGGDMTFRKSVNGGSKFELIF